MRLHGVTRRKDARIPYGPYNRLDFGKWSGYLVQAVIEKDPDWLVWALENVAQFELTDEAEEALDEVLS